MAIRSLKSFTRSSPTKDGLGFSVATPSMSFASPLAKPSRLVLLLLSLSLSLLLFPSEKLQTSIHPRAKQASKLEIANCISSRFSQFFFLGELQIWQSFSSFVVFQLLCCWHLQQHDQLFEQLLDRERACDLSSKGCSDDEDGGGGGTTRKKLRLSKEQSALLEESFKDHSTLNPVWTRMSDSLLLPLSWFLSRVFPLGHCSFCTVSSAAYLWWYLCGWLPSAEAKERLGKTTKLATSASGSLVPKQKSKVCTYL